MTATQTRSEAVEQFEREGYVLFPHVLDADLIGEAGEHVEWLQAEASRPAPGTTRPYPDDR